MTKTSKLKLLIAVALAILAAVTFGLALHLSTVNIAVAEDVNYDADGDLVCDGNTASYTTEADQYWDYDDASNTYTGKTSSTSTLTLTIINGGNVQFYAVPHNGSGGGSKITISEDESELLQLGYNDRSIDVSNERYLAKGDGTGVLVTVLDMQIGNKLVISAVNVRKTSVHKISGLQVGAKATFETATDNDKIQLSQNNAGKCHWNQLGGGIYQFTPEGEFIPDAVFATAVLYTFDAQEDDIVSFKYSMTASECPVLSVTLDDVEITDFACQLTNNNDTYISFDFPVAQGNHVLKVVCTTESGHHITNLDLRLKDFQVRAKDTVETKSIEFNYCNQLTVEGEEKPVEIYWQEMDNSGTLKGDRTKIETNGSVTFPIGKRIRISIEGLTKGGLKNSVIDPTQQVATSGEGYWRSNLEGFDEKILYYSGDELQLFPSFVLIAQESGINVWNYQFIAGSYLRYSTWQYFLFGEETTTIDFDMIEYAPMPKISATKSVDSDEGETVQIEEGKIIEFPFSHDNKVSVKVQKFNEFTTDDIGIMVDGKDYSDSFQDFGGEEFFFAHQVKNRATISVYYRKADEQTVIYSKYSCTFGVLETVEGSSISDVNHTPIDTKGNLVIGNDTAENEWEFDPEFSTADNYAYGLKVEEWFSGRAFYGMNQVSNLTFTMTGAETGSLSFQFRLEGHFMDAQIVGDPIRSGQLWWRSGTAFSMEDVSTVGVRSGNAWTEELAGATWLGRPKTTNDGGMDYAFGNGVIEVGDGWYQVNVPIQEGTPLYLGFLVSGNESVGFADQRICYAAIRNVTLITGDRNVSLKICSDASEKSSATATVGSQPYTATVAGEPITVTAGALVQLSATLDDGDVFYGWTVGGVLVSTEKEANVYINDDCDIVAWIAPQGYYVARANGTFYQSVKDAADNAQSGQTIYLLNAVTRLTESFTIPKGVTFLLPFDDTNRLTELGSAATAQNKIAWLGSTYHAFRSVTVASGVTITVNGTLAIGGVMGIPGSTVYQGHTSGAYSEMILEKNSKILVNEGGVMDVYGRVWGGEGKTGDDMGAIDVKKGGKLYEPFLILDFAGGSNTLGLYSAGQTPFKRYAMINIECPITVNYGGALVGHASLYALNQFFSLDQTFIGDDSVLQVEGGNETFVMLSGSNSKVTITYDASRALTSAHGGNVGDCTEGIGLIKMVFEGGAKFSYMLFSAMGVTVPTNPVYFSIPYNYEIEMNGQGAEYETRTDFKIMPGAKVTLGEGATLTLNANAYVYDGLVLPYLPNTSKNPYPSAENLEASGYSRSGTFIVNGTLKIGLKTKVEGFDIGSILGGSSSEFVPGTIPATFLGIIQTSGKTGKIVIPAETVLKGTIVDGVADTAHYFAYTTSARVWVANLNDAQGGFTDLVAGKNYVATGADSFTLSEVKYKTTADGEEDKTLTVNSAMKGAWMLEHEHHEYEWTPSDEEKPTAEDPWKSLTRECTVLGCTHEETTYLLYKFDSITSQQYKGAAFTTDELANLFKAMYKELPEGVTATVELVNVAEIKNATTYTVKVKLEGASFVIGNELKSEETFTFEVTKKAIEVKISDQSADYSGNEPTVSQTAFTYPNGNPFEGDTLGFSIKKVAGVKANTYNLTAEESKDTQFANGNYDVTITYTGEGHSTFKINKVTIHVTPKDYNSPEGEEPIPTSEFTSTVTGFVNGEEETLEAGILAALHYTCEVTKDSVKGTYDIHVSYSGTLENYDVDCSAKGTYTVMDPLFAGVHFTNTDAVTYDGQAHAFTVTGHEGLKSVQVTITYKKGGQDVDADDVKDVGDYEVTAVISAQGDNGQTYSQTLTATLKINKLDVHVTLLAQSKIYDGQPALPSSEKDVGWKFTTENFKLCGNDEVTVLGIDLSIDGENKNAGDHTILTSKNDNGNYNVIFDNVGTNLYKIEKKAVAVTIKNVATTYGDGSTTAEHAGDYEYDEKLIVDGDSITVTLNFSAVDLTAANTAGYPITATASANNDNYTFTFTEDAKWTVAPKPITVVVTPAEATYSGQEPAAPTQWTLKAGSTLGFEDTNSDLNVTLTKELGVNAGSYDITGAWNNDNYTVTFEGEENAYTINKRDVSTDGSFFIMAGDEMLTGNLFRIKFAGSPITFTGYVLLGTDTLPVTLAFSPDKITEIGEFSLTVTVNDTNYSGSKTFRVVVTNAEGYTKRLVETLAQLEELTEGMTAETLTADDFDTLKQVATLLAALDDEEKAIGAEKLAPYEALVAAWGEAVEGLDRKIETAQSVGDAVLNGLFGAIATVSALAAVAYVLKKGGIL